MKLVALASLGLMLAGCGVGRHVQQGIDDYHRADYLAAGYRFQSVGPDEDEMTVKGLARYLVFRGLTEYRIGMRAEARGHLLRARDVIKVASPDAVDPKTLHEMDEALAELDGDLAPATAPVVAADPPPV